jgi:hypothetical protein
VIITSRKPMRGSARAAIPVATILMATTLLGVSAVGPLGPPPASAAPTISGFRTIALPIPGFPGTGNVLGAGAIIQGEAKVSGTEYGGSPPPVVGIKFFAPVGAKVNSQGFTTCATSVLERSGPIACAKKSAAGPKGTVTGVVSFAGERVPETASVQPFFAPGGGLEAFVDGSSPVSLEIVAKAHFVGSAPPYGLQFTGEVPLIETVPGAPDASFVEGKIQVGAAYRQGKKVISYVTIPAHCPPGGWPVKLELDFFGGAVSEAAFKMPCPRVRG